MGNYTESVGYYQGLARRYYYFLPAILDRINSLTVRGIPLPAAREETFALVDKENPHNAIQGLHPTFWEDCRGIPAWLIQGVFPELSESQAGDIARRAEKGKRRYIRSIYGRNWKNNLRRHEAEIREASRRAGEALCRSEGCELRPGGEMVLEINEKYHNAHAAFRGMVDRKYQKAPAPPALVNIPSPRPVRRTAPRATRSAAKSGDDGGGDDPGDGQGEPPKSSRQGRIIPPAPVHRAQYTPFTKNQQSAPAPWRHVLPGQWRMERGRAA